MDDMILEDKRKYLALIGNRIVVGSDSRSYLSSLSGLDTKHNK